MPRVYKVKTDLRKLMLGFLEAKIQINI